MKHRLILTTAELQGLYDTLQAVRASVASSALTPFVEGEEIRYWLMSELATRLYARLDMARFIADRPKPHRIAIPAATAFALRDWLQRLPEGSLDGHHWATLLFTFCDQATPRATTQPATALAAWQ